jgi:hypothetical protein
MKKLDKDLIYEIIQKEGYELVSDEYINNRSPLLVKCDKGHIYETNYHRFQDHNGKKGKRCPYCYGNKRITIEQVSEYATSIGYVLLSKKYKNNRTLMDFICDKGHTYSATFDSLKSGHRCCFCMKGKNTSIQEDEIVDIINKTISVEIIRNDKKTILNPKTNYFLELDIWMPSIRKAIEFNSKYWHKSRIENDEYKIKYCKENNIKLLIIWYHDWIRDMSMIEEKIKRFLSNE